MSQTCLQTLQFSCSLGREQLHEFCAVQIANLVKDMLTNPTVVQLHVKMHDFDAIHIANLVTDMLTNPTVVHLHVTMYVFYAILIANLVTDMFTNPTVVHCAYKRIICMQSTLQTL